MSDPSQSYQLAVPIGLKTAPMSRAQRRLIKRLNRDGDHCHGCRREYRGGDRAFVGHDAAGRALQVGECCATRLTSILAFSIYFAPRPTEAWAANDRDWFTTHPDRSHRLRKAYPGEWPPKQATPYTIIKQREPGVRLRLGIRVMPELLDMGEPPEEAVWAMFDLAFEAAEKGARTVLTADIMGRYRALTAAARA